MKCGFLLGLVLRKEQIKRKRALSLNGQITELLSDDAPPRQGDHTPSSHEEELPPVVADQKGDEKDDPDTDTSTETLVMTTLVIENLGAENFGGWEFW